MAAGRIKPYRFTSLTAVILAVIRQVTKRATIIMNQEEYLTSSLTFQDLCLRFLVDFDAFGVFPCFYPLTSAGIRGVGL